MEERLKELFKEERAKFPNFPCADFDFTAYKKAKERYDQEIMNEALQKPCEFKTNKVYDNGYGIYFCPNCKGSVWQIKDESNYCFRCGQKLEW